MKYKALVEATGDNQQASDAVLIHAVSCIYAPQPTGYAAGGESSAQCAKSVIELLSKPITPSSDYKCRLTKLTKIVQVKTRPPLDALTRAFYNGVIFSGEFSVIFQEEKTRKSCLRKRY